MIKSIIYGTEDYLSYFVKASFQGEGIERKDVLYASFLSEEKARKKAEELAEELNVPMARI